MMSVLKMYYCKRKEKKNTSTFHQPVCFSSLLEPQQKDWTTDPSSPAHRYTQTHMINTSPKQSSGKKMITFKVTVGVNTCIHVIFYGAANQ